jgi:hypothetical protein
MSKGHHWYNLDIPVATPRGIEFSAPPTAPSIINDAADHLAGNWPEFIVKPLRESQTAEKDMERVQISLNSMYDLIAREYGKALHRTLAIHGGWSGMMAARVYVHDGWDLDKPTIDDISWMPLDPRYVYPDPATLGREYVIYRQRRTVGSIRQSWPDWEGQWYSPAGWGSWNTGPESKPKLNERLPDWMVVDFIEYWDDRVKCFISNGYPVFREAYGNDIVPHGMGINPIIVKSAGYGDDTGEPHERFRSMLYYIFAMLEAEARLWTQYKWIVEDTAWPTILAHQSLRPLDLTPASVNYSDDIQAIEKGIRTIRDDAVEPKAVVDTLSWVQGVIERATYPTILKGQAPNGIRAGYPIAILSTQAKLKFASPSDALRSMLEDLAYKTMAIIHNRMDTPVEVIDNYKILPDDYGKYRGRVRCRLDPNLPTDKAASIPILELAVGSLGLPKEAALKELGYEDPLELRDLRLAEDLAEDPRVRQVMAEHLIKFLAPEYAQAVSEESQSNIQLQKMQETIQMLTGRVQEISAQMQLQQTQQQQGSLQSTGMPPGMPGTAPTQSPPGPWGGARPGSGGAPPGGQNPQNPNQIGQSFETVNPMTAEATIARQLRAQRSISDLTTQQAAFGSPNA